jgi:lipopolysaccharide transport protein LptA
MKSLLLLCATLLLAWQPLSAQTADDDVTADPTPPAGSTLITSDELHSDQANHVSIFTGKVVVIGTNFKMTCQEMTVNFTKDNKIDTIVATGDVVITQPDRITHCGRADYYHDEDKFVLTQSPVIIDKNKNQESAPTITIYRTSQKMETSGGRTHLILGPQAMSTPSDTPATDTK